MHPTRIFKTPEELEKAWKDYKESLIVRAKDWPKIQYVGKEGAKKIDYPKLPPNQDGFEVYCYDIYGCVHQYFKNQDGLYKDFMPLCSRIRQEIKDDHITGGLLHVYNASITQRLHGLKDESSVTVKEQPFFPEEE